MDNDGNRKLTAEEFYYGLNEIGCNLTKEETDILLTHFDKDRDGTVNFDEFLIAIRGQLNPTR